MITFSGETEKDGTWPWWYFLLKDIIIQNIFITILLQLLHNYSILCNYIRAILLLVSSIKIYTLSKSICWDIFSYLASRLSQKLIAQLCTNNGEN